MGDRYRERWESRQARWEARRAKWEARAARHEERRAARHAKWRTGSGSDSSERSSPTDMALLGFFGGLFVILGLIPLVLLPGVLSLVGLFVCLVPGISMLIPVIIWARDRSRASAAAGGPITGETKQAVPQASQGRPDAQTGEAMPQAAASAPVVPSQAVEPARQPASAANPDPSYYRERAAGYRRSIQSVIRSRRPGPLADVMLSVVTNLQQWEERVGQLADRLLAFEQDSIIQRDIKEVPANLARLCSQIESEPDAYLQEQMQRTLAGYRSQQAMLDTLVQLMRRTRLLLDDTLVAMGTIYSQVRVLDAMDIDSAQTARVAEELDGQVKRLSDLLSALGDAYGGANQPDGVADSARRIRLERGSAAGS